MKFIIDRKKWYRGHYQGSKLLRKDGLQCCVGQMCSQLGVPKVLMKDVGDVRDLIWATDNDRQQKIRDALSNVLIQPQCKSTYFPYDWAPAPWLRDAYGYNDDAGLTDEEREQHLIRLCEKNGHELQFIN
jgi:hypothetical protein